MTVEQFISDLDELVDVVCERLGTTKVAIFGHSWGTALGVLYAARFPEKVAAYADSGQIGDWAAGESASYGLALAQGQRLGKHRAVTKLRAIGRRTLPRAGGRSACGCHGSRAAWRRGRCGSWRRAALAGQESSIIDLPKTVRGFRFALGTMWTEVSRLNLIEPVPVCTLPAAT